MIGLKVLCLKTETLLSGIFWEVFMKVNGIHACVRPYVLYVCELFI